MVGVEVTMWHALALVLPATTSLTHPPSWNYHRLRAP